MNKYICADCGKEMDIHKFVYDMHSQRCVTCFNKWKANKGDVVQDDRN